MYMARLLSVYLSRIPITMTGNENVQDKAMTELTAQNETTKPKFDNDKEFQDDVMDPEPENDTDGESQA